MRLFSTLSAAALAAVLLAPAQAAEKRDFAQIYIDCGLGALIAPRHDVVAVITNVTWDLGTTAISSELSSPESCKGGQQKVASFLIQNQSAVETALASGEGAHLDALVALGQCGGDVIAAKTGLRQGFVEVVASAEFQTADSIGRSQAVHQLVDSQCNI
jgi:hypothetical protein